MSGRALAFAVVLLAGLPAFAQEKETVAIPDSPIKFDLVRLKGGKAKVGSPESEPGRGKDEAQRDVDLKPFWIGAREVTWDEYSLYYEGRKAAKLDGVTRPS